MSVKKANIAAITKDLSEFGNVKSTGSKLPNGDIEGLKVSTKKTLDGPKIRRLAEISAAYPNRMEVKRSGAFITISID